MAEPAADRVRRTPMKTSVVLPVALLVLIGAGCGNDAAGGSSAESGRKAPPAAAQKIGPCAPDAPGVTRASALAKADLDGDGTPEAVQLTSPDGSCPNVVFAKVGSAYVSAQVPTNGPPVAKAQAVTVPGVKGQLLVTTQTHPRGGFQLRLYSLAGSTLKELTNGDQPLVPFIATDVQEHPLSLSCKDGALVKTEAVAHEPRGVAFAWDIKQTAYTLGADGVSAGPTEEIADNVLPAQLDEKYAGLAGHTMFQGCA